MITWGFFRILGFRLLKEREKDMNELEFAEIRLVFDLQNDFKTRADAKKVREALAVVLGGKLPYNKLTVEKALLTLRTRVHRYNMSLLERGES